MPHPLEHSAADRHLSEDEAQSIAERMRAFGTGSRLQLLFALLDSELSVEELAERTGLSANSASQQLRVLRQQNFVIASRQGRHVHYRLHDHHIGDLLTAIRHHHEHAEEGWRSAPSQRSSARA